MEKPYIQLANSLRRDIISGKYGWEGGLPGIKELVRQSGLNQGTVQSALRFLLGERLLIQRDRAWYVNRIMYPVTSFVLPVSERMTKLGREGYIRNVGQVRYGTMPEHLADKAGVDPDSVVIVQDCVLGELQGSNEVPHQYSHFYHIIPVFDELFQRMQVDARLDPVELCGPEKLVRTDELSSRLPVHEEVEILNIPSSLCVTSCLGVVRDIDGNALLVQEDTMVPRVTFVYHYQYDNHPPRD